MAAVGRAEPGGGTNFRGGRGWPPAVWVAVGPTVEWVGAVTDGGLGAVADAGRGAGAEA